MIAPARRAAGQPLAVLGAVIGLWVIARVALWQSPFPLDLPLQPGPLYKDVPVSLADTAQVRPGRPPGKRAAVAQVDRLSTPALEIAPEILPPAYRIFEPAALASRGEPIDESTASQLMWLAALSAPSAPSRPYVPATSPRPQAAPFDLRPPLVRAQPGRWSMASWLYLRQGSGRAGAVGSLAAPSYGASQAGAVLRYDLAPGSRHRPAAYARVSSALRNPGEAELAAGITARPLRAVPVAVMAEARLREQGGDMRVRPGIMVVSELAPRSLPLGLESHLYLQAGYVGGRDATAFADGQWRVTGGVGRIGPGAVRAGAGAWGGAQKGAARLDIGPTAQLDVPLAGGGARLALDYRVRVGGDAAPGSGIALTLSTGF